MSVYTLTSPPNSGQNNKLRIIVIDNEPIVAFAIRKILIYQQSQVTVATSVESNDLIELCKKNNPTLIILDPVFLGVCGIDIVNRIKRLYPNVKIILYARESDCHASLDEYVQCRINAIVLKKNSINNLQKAIHAVTHGYTFMDSELSVSRERTDNASFDYFTQTLSLPRLSNREKQVLKYVTEGCTNKIIARKLSISIKTVESHRLNMMRKLDAHNVIDLVTWAKRLNIH